MHFVASASAMTSRRLPEARFLAAQQRAGVGGPEFD
jgi:hypothetical protein